MFGEFGVDFGLFLIKVLFFFLVVIGVVLMMLFVLLSTSCESSSYCGIDIFNSRGLFIFVCVCLMVLIVVCVMFMILLCLELIEFSGCVDVVIMDECSCVGVRIVSGRFSVGGLFGCLVIVLMGV